MLTTIKAEAISPHDISNIVDVRTQDEFLQEHIPGSRNIPLDTLANSLSELKQYPKLIVSCRSGNRASQACEQLSALGFSNLLLLEGGIQGWKQAKRETVSLKKGFSIMQQVQIIVGCMILTGTFIKSLWFLAPIAGIGMLLAGLSNTCMMAVILSKMPWNKTEHSISHCSIKNN